MTNLEVMRERAHCEFDRLVVQREHAFRESLAAAGYDAVDVERIIAENRPSIEAQRDTIGSIVAIALLKANVPLHEVATNDPD